MPHTGMPGYYSTILLVVDVYQGYIRKLYLEIYIGLKIISLSD